MNVASEVKLLSVGLVRHDAGMFHTAELSTLGRPSFAESAIEDVGEVPFSSTKQFGLSGADALVDDVLTKVAGTPVLTHEVTSGGSMTEALYPDVKVGQSALTAEVAHAGSGVDLGFDGGFGGGGATTYRLVFPTDKPPAGIKDALAALGKLSDAAHANGELATGGAA